MANVKRTYVTDPTSAYSPVDVDDDTSTRYYGFQRADGAWYIQRETTDSGDTLFRYVGGASGYATSWTARASQDYGYPEDTFE